jgi:polysaccharide biosynthesis protein PslG
MRALGTRRPAALILAVLILMASFATVAPAGAAGPFPKIDLTGRQARPAGPSFGVTAHFMWHSREQTSAEIERIAAAGFRVVRFDLGWRWVEPERKGGYDEGVLRQFDWTLAQLDARGIAPIVTVIETPAWARPAGTGMFAPPTNRQDYADVLRMLAARHAGRANVVWEVWNEPNLVQFWEGGPDAAAYADLLKRAYVAIKGVAPAATVLGGSIAFNDAAFLRGMYAAGAAGHFDALAIHPYTGGRAPADDGDPWFSLRGQLRGMRATLVAHGDGDKPLYVTEFGWSTDDVSDATRATYLREAVAIMREYPFVRAATVYTINGADYPAYGLVTPAGVETASWRAYAAATR